MAKPKFPPMDPPESYADTAATELAKAAGATNIPAAEMHVASAQVWATLALAAAIEGAH